MSITTCTVVKKEKKNCHRALFTKNHGNIMDRCTLSDENKDKIVDEQQTSAKYGYYNDE